MKYFIKLLPHLSIILCVVFMVFLVLDQYNPTMNFVGNEISQVMLWVLCISSVVNAVITVALIRNNNIKKLECFKKQNGK